MSRKSANAAVRAVEAIERRGILLVYPINNRKDIPSIWSEFFPKSEMRWDWDSTGDDRVADLWHLKTQLSSSGKVVYGKWFRGRATFFSKDVFTCLLRLLGTELGLSRHARQILEVLRMDSPLSTKQLKAAAGLQGRDNEGDYQRGLKELFERMLVVGYGEFEDGAFPSLAIGATRLLFEDLWEASRKLSTEEALRRLQELPGEDSPWLKQLVKTQAKLGELGSSVEGAGFRGQQRETRHRQA